MAEPETMSGKLFIPFTSIEDHIQCSICLSAIRGAVLTPCGHRYCTRCITEWVGRNHTCPCCNSALNAGQFYCDVQFDGLVDAVLGERDKAEEEFYNKVFNQVPVLVDQSSSVENFGTFEQILKKHMKSSLLSHKRYFNNLQLEFKRKLSLLESGNTGEKYLEHLKNEGTSNDDIVAILSKNLAESEQLAAFAFDKYLETNVPSLEVLPVTVSVYLADKDIRIDDITFSPSDSLSFIKPLIEATMRQKNNEIVAWAEDEGVKLLFGPLMKRSKYDIDEILSNLGQGEPIHPLQWNSKLIFQHSLRPGSEIVLHQVFQCESDLPKQCFTDTYTPGSEHTCDYFTCVRCKVNWICKSCIESCHEGHDTRPFAMNHTPTWACCYCPKKKLCQIQTASAAIRMSYGY